MFYTMNEQKLKVHVCDICWLLGLREILEIIMANGLGMTLSLCVCVYTRLYAPRACANDSP